MPKINNSTQRRRNLANKILSLGFLTMRPCSSCVRLSVPCFTSPAHESCEQCLRANRSCDLAAPLAEIDRVLQKAEKLQTEALEAEAKAHRLRKQRRSLLKKARELGAREEKNIEELEVDEMMAVGVPEAQPERVTSPTGLSQVSFGSLYRNSPVPAGSS